MEACSQWLSQRDMLHSAGVDISRAGSGINWEVTEEIPALTALLVQNQRLGDQVAHCGLIHPLRGLTVDRALRARLPGPGHVDLSRMETSRTAHQTPALLSGCRRNLEEDFRG